MFDALDRALNAAVLPVFGTAATWRPVVGGELAVRVLVGRRQQVDEAGGSRWVTDPRVIRVRVSDLVATPVVGDRIRIAGESTDRIVQSPPVREDSGGQWWTLDTGQPDPEDP